MKQDNTKSTNQVILKPKNAREVHRPVSKSENMQKKPSEGLVKNMPEAEKTQTKSIVINIVVSIVVVTLGMFSGWGLSEVLGNPVETSVEEKSVVKKEEIAVGSVYGREDKSTFIDSAEGVLLKGGIDGEGSHRLLRPGGETQTVYLTSSVVDLDPLVGSKVEIWGDTFAAQKANWLMDVGRIEVLEMDAQKPFEEAE